MTDCDPLFVARQILAGLADPAVLLDRELRPVCFNTHYCSYVGTRPRQLQQAFDRGMSPFDIFARDPVADAELAGQALCAGKPIHLAESVVPAPSGRTYVMMQSFIPVSDTRRQTAGIIQSFRDMSAEVRLHERYQVLLGRERARAKELAQRVHESSRQLKLVEAQSATDHLTGVLNRRAFEPHVERALQNAERDGGRFALLMCDLDHFKRVNDAYGHQAGDAALVAVGEALSACLRARDRLARFGGEEFAVLLADIDAPRVAPVAERFVHRVRAIPMNQRIPGFHGSQTISIGAAVFPTGGATPEELFRRADLALYRAKARGRNQACVYDEQPRRAHASA